MENNNNENKELMQPPVNTGFAITPFKDEELSIDIIQDILQSWLKDLPVKCKDKKVKCPDCLDINGSQLCRMEVNYCALLYKAYTAQLGIDQRDLIHQKLVKDLVKVDLKLYRLENENDGTFEMDQAVGMGEDGEVIYQKQMAIKVDYEAHLYRTKLALLKQLGIKMQGGNVAEAEKQSKDYSVIAARVKANPRLRRELEEKRAKKLGV